MRLGDDEVFFLPYNDDDNCCLVYAPLRSYIAIAHKEFKSRIIAKDSSVIDAFLERLKTRPFIDVSKIHNQMVAAKPDLMLEITDDCNLRCKYCHASAGEQHKNRTMSFSLIAAVIKAFFHNNNTKETIIICFSGGEPTFAASEFEYAVKVAQHTAKEMGLNCRFRMATNGCFDDNIRQFIIDNKFEISLSFDGPERIQNIHRPFADGSPSFDIVNRNAHLLYESKIPLAFRATISKYSLEFLKEVAGFFATNFPGRQVGIEPMNPFGRGLNDKLLGIPSRRQFATKLVEIMKTYENKPIVFDNAGVGKFETLRTVFCSAVAIPSWTVSTDGTISACSRDNAPDLFNIGHFDELSNNFFIDEKRVEKLRSFNIFNMDECSDCFCKYHCAGDCLDLRIAGLQECLVNRSIGQHYLNKKVAGIRKEANNGKNN